MMFMAGVLTWDHGKREAKMVVSPSASAFHKSIGKQFSQFELSRVMSAFYIIWPPSWGPNRLTS